MTRARRFCRCSERPSFRRYGRRHLAALFVISAPFALIGEAFQWLVGPVIVNDAGGQVVGFNAASIIRIFL